MPSEWLKFTCAAPTWNGEDVKYLNDSRQEAPELKYKAAKFTSRHTKNVNIHIAVNKPIWLNSYYLRLADQKPGKGCDPKNW